NPEFLREGHAIQDTLNPDRLVLGRYVGGTAEQLTNEIYADLLASGTPLLVTDPTTAELVKTAANAFLATKISFINAIAEISDLVGANVTDIADAMGYDDRIGRKFLNAGLGFGGGCLPKDIRGLMARAGELGAAEAVAFLREVDNINMRRRMRMVEVARECCGGNLVGARIAILGAAFKPDSDDVRDSPALNVAGQLQLSGAMVTVYDPKSNENSRAVFPTLEYADSALDASRAADLVLVLTEWRELTELDPNDLSAVVARKYIVDGRRCLDRRRWEASGWGYRA
ncbi:UDP-glucose/GDP-mannose dehydrogenase family protein, partial [uncultured Gordonia sp.]